MAGQRCLLVASTGGHLFQLAAVARQVGVHSQSTFLTFDTPQSRSLVADNSAVYVPYVAPRDYMGVVKTVPIVAEILSDPAYTAVVSTGAGLALSALPLAAVRRRRSIYIESVSRITGPSMTGQFLAGLPKIERYTQHRHWEGPRWRFCGSVLDLDMAASSVRQQRHGGRPMVLVSLGTIRPYRFDRLVRAVEAALPASVDVVWQLGATQISELPGRIETEISPEAFEELAASADLVISHGGVATALSLVSLGVKPILVPRLARWNEHVDDHQRQICTDLAARGLAHTPDSDDLVGLLSERMRTLNGN